MKPVVRLVYDLILDADGPWAKAPEKGKREAAHVLQVYAGHYNPLEGVSRPGVKTVAKLTHHKRETVRAAKRWLEDEGFIELVDAGGGKANTASYRLNVPGLKGSGGGGVSGEQRGPFEGQRGPLADSKGSAGGPGSVLREEENERAQGGARSKKAGRELREAGLCRRCATPVTALQANNQLALCDDCYAEYEAGLGGAA